MSTINEMGPGNMRNAYSLRFCRLLFLSLVLRFLRSSGFFLGVSSFGGHFLTNDDRTTDEGKVSVLEMAVRVYVSLEFEGTV